MSFQRYTSMKRKIDKKQRQTIIYICLHARDIFNRLRWPNGVVCPKCGEVHIWHYKNGTYKCSKCGHRFSDTSGTIFHSTKVPLSYWIVCLYCITMLKGISSEEVSQYLSITQKTAWYIMHILRCALDQKAIVLEGDIAVDEVYLGGKWSSIIVPKKIGILKKYDLWYEGDVERTWHKKNVRRAISEYKQPVYGMNDGKHIVLQAVPNRFDSQDLLQLTLEYTGNVNRLISDQSVLYKEIAKTGIEVIQMNHSKREFHNGEFSSNRIEGTFSHLKRRTRCNYVRPTKKYTQLYLNEFCFRWNNRDKSAMDRLAIAMHLCTSRGPITRRGINSYNWIDKYHQRVPKHYDTIDNWINKGIDPFTISLVDTITIGGIVYDRKKFEEIKRLREEQIYHIDESELVF